MCYEQLSIAFSEYQHVSFQPILFSLMDKCPKCTAQKQFINVRLNVRSTPGSRSMLIIHRHESCWMRMWKWKSEGLISHTNDSQLSQLKGLATMIPSKRSTDLSIYFFRTETTTRYKIRYSHESGWWGVDIDFNTHKKDGNKRYFFFQISNELNNCISKPNSI